MGCYCLEIFKGFRVIVAFSFVLSFSSKILLNCFFFLFFALMLGFWCLLSLCLCFFGHLFLMQVLLSFILSFGYSILLLIVLFVCCILLVSALLFDSVVVLVVLWVDVFLLDVLIVFGLIDVYYLVFNSNCRIIYFFSIHNKITPL